MLKRIHNDFYFGRTLPHAVIALDTPRFSAYEAQLLRHIFLRNSNKNGAQQQPQQPQPHLTRFGRPLLVCADGAFRRVQTALSPALAAATVDFVVGDLDSLRPPASAICATVDRVSDFDAPRSAAQLARALQSDQGSSSSSSNNGGGGGVQQQQRRPFVLRVLDQDTTDFEKSLALCEELLLSGKPAAAEAAVADSCGVLVIGGHGGEWHHQMAVIHAAAKYTAKTRDGQCGASTAASGGLDVTLHTPDSTIMFCAPNGRTVFQRNADCECSVFALVPFGRSPRKIVTRGLKWELDRTAAATEPHFGWSHDARSNPAFISTSNKFAGDSGAVTIDLECDPDSVVAISVNNSAAYIERMMAVDDVGAAQSKL